MYTTVTDLFVPLLGKIHSHITSSFLLYCSSGNTCISNMRDSVSSGYPNTKERRKYDAQRSIFSQ